MYIQVSSSAWGLSPCVLMEPCDFTKFHVTAAAHDDVADVAGSLRSYMAGQSADTADQVLISVGWLRDNAPAHDVGWQRQLDAMILEAQRKGWLSADGLAIKAHIQRV